MTPGADGQCQAYHYHHQLPGTAEYTGTLWKQIISRKQDDQIVSDFIHILHKTLILSMFIKSVRHCILMNVECFIMVDKRGIDPF